MVKILLLVKNGQKTRHGCVKSEHVLWKEMLIRKKLRVKTYLKTEKIVKQAGAELGQAQLKLGFDFTLIFCRFGFYSFGLVELV